VRVLVMEDDATIRRLLHQHVTTAVDGAIVVDRVPGEEGRLPVEFNAAGYDAVLLDHAPAGASGLEWLADGRARPLFPPVIYLLATADEAAAALALQHGALGVLAKDRIDHRRLASLLREAEAAQRRALAAFRASPAAEKAYRFGDITVRGVRCIRPLASSAISTVYLAESEREARLVAFKLLRQPPEGARPNSTFERFLQEYEIIRAIQHPNVVQIYDLGIADDHAYIEMEYFPSGDLRSRIKLGLGPPEALTVLTQMAAALKAIHEAGVLHRDLKPGNVMMRADGTIALIDFGLAKQLSLEAEITATGEIFGTPYYMSPEQGHGRDVDARGDLYSLGVIFYEMLTGRKPYLAPTPMAVIYRHSHSPIPQLPAPLSGWQPLLEKLLAKDLAGRFQSADELLATLAALPPLQSGAGAAP
jgi:DNA-binding response OmpR family regulator